MLRSVVALMALLLSAPSSVHALEDCSLITRMMNTIGASMARNRMLIASSVQTGDNKEAAEEASALLSRQTRNFRELREDYVRNRCGNDWE